MRFLTHSVRSILGRRLPPCSFCADAPTLTATIKKIDTKNFLITKIKKCIKRNFQSCDDTIDSYVYPFDCKINKKFNKTAKKKEKNSIFDVFLLILSSDE